MSCREEVMSEEYADFIVNFIGSDEEALERFQVKCFQRISSYYGSIYVPLSMISDITRDEYVFRGEYISRGGNVSRGMIMAQDDMGSPNH